MRILVTLTLLTSVLMASPAHAEDEPGVTAASFEQQRRPRVTGVRRFGHTLEAHRGRWHPSPTSVRNRWLRNGDPIPGATGKRHQLGVRDVGAKVSVRVVVRASGYADQTAESRAREVRHRVAVRHTVRYTVATRGRIAASVSEFARLAQQTLDDPRGWRGAGVRFVRVAEGGAFTLFLSQARMVPSFGYPCDSYFSCRVGNAVIINQDRWLGATPVWNGSGRSLRDYRNLVVNHETGHWLGHRHRFCGGPGQLAPVMMQQSKGLHGCRANPWPVPGERGTPRF